MPSIPPSPIHSAAASKKLRVISTPNGLNNGFAQLWHSNYESDSPAFHASKITIDDAIAAGLRRDPAELQAGLNDPEAWAQKYLCQFIDNSSVLPPTTSSKRSGPLPFDITKEL